MKQMKSTMQQQFWAGTMKLQLNYNTLTLLKAAGISVLAICLCSCAAIQKSSCNTDTAYSQGVNDARGNRDMQTNYAYFCPASQSQINAAYGRGYKTVLKHQINKGYGPHRDDGWTCLDSYGKKVCGYNCIKDNLSKVYRGQHRYDNCVEDSFNKIKCGKHCRIDMNSAICDKERYSKESSRP